MESVKKLIIVPVNDINQKVNICACLRKQSKSNYLFLLMESLKMYIIVPVNGINQKVNICAC